MAQVRKSTFCRQEDKDGIYEVGESVVHCELGVGDENVLTITNIGPHLRILDVIAAASR